MYFQKSKWQCEKCNNIFSQEQKFKKHKATDCTSLTPAVVKKFKCNDCGRFLSTKNSLKSHKSQNCKRVKADEEELYCCDKCGKAYKTKGNFVKHSKLCKQYLKPKQSLYHCRQCNEQFKDRRALYLHSNQHGFGEKNTTSNFKLTNPPWLGENGELVDKQLKEVYESNRRHIYADNNIGKVLRSYNFPTNNLSGGVDEIMNHLKEIYEKQKSSFKVNINLGFILRDKLTGQLRFFIPFKNSYLLSKPYLVTRFRSLRALRDKIEKLNIPEYLINSRPNSRFEPVFITNIRYDITLTNYALGGKAILPNWIVHS